MKVIILSLILIKIGTEIILNGTDEKILGVYFDNKLSLPI